MDLDVKCKLVDIVVLIAWVLGLILIGSLPDAVGGWVGLIWGVVGVAYLLVGRYMVLNYFSIPVEKIIADLTKEDKKKK